MTPQRFLGCWPIPDDTHRNNNLDMIAIEGLAKLCGEHLMLPAGNASVATFSDRIDVLIAAHILGVQLVDILALAEKIGFKRGKSFVAAACDVRAAHDVSLRERRTLRSVG